MRVIPCGSVNRLFGFNYPGVDAMDGGLEGINRDKRKYDTSLNKFKDPPSLEYGWNPADVSSVASDNGK